MNLPKALGDHSENFDFLTFWSLNFDFFEISFFFCSEAKIKSYFFKNHDFGGFRLSNHGGSIGLAESYSKMGINFSGDE